ncbi:Six-hairpin glycosidase-like protein [Choanephora cucurbitarum]|nr:Six-hairpin glycosidase-like protein [Choanephora cucurbitarum]
MIKLHSASWFLLALLASLSEAADSTKSPLLQQPLPPLKGPYVAPTTAKYNYAEVLHKSYLFYHAQRSGPLPYQRLAWRSDSCKVCVGEFGEDLSKGWYEAANTMKWGLPIGWTLTQLAFNIMVFEDSMKSVDELAEGLELIKWGADYIANAHYNDTYIVGQLGTSAIGPISKSAGLDVDFNYFGPPEEFEQWVPTGLPHKAYYITPENPSSEIVGEYSAALAASSLVWRKHNQTYADFLLNKSKRLFKFAIDHPGSYVTSRDNAFQWATFWYPSTHYEDELAWSAAWLYAATRDDYYLKQIDTLYTNASDSWNEYSWDEKGGGLHVLLYTLTKDPKYYKNAMTYFNQFLPNPKQVVKFTPRGLAYIEHWGSVGYSGNVAFLMMAFAKAIGYHTKEGKAMTTFATQQINYALGDYGHSWVVGFGDKYPQKPYHKSSYNSYIDYPMRGEFQEKVRSDFLDSKTPQRFILYGAVEGGPNNDDTWYDDRTNYEYSEVTQDYNAAWTGAIAGLIDFYGAENFEPYTDCGLDLGWSHKNASAPPAWPADDCYHTCNKNCPRGKMQSSYSWKLLTAKSEALPDYLDVLYPGQGVIKAAALDSNLLISSPAKHEDDSPLETHEDLTVPKQQQSASTHIQANVWSFTAFLIAPYVFRLFI